ncbi:Clp protease ClpP [Thermoactinomyces daqus]|uniref:ATP-dependent Clp protease proteolytic subunit n=1 Tax=Thermoactinomyces daqus TaxID=1329516 RepID=A0A7W2AJ22_9BACL|nr:head maturation protease, ClpP-related [Thermoactinomyces daqus]MBA4544366.1 Clp protease ClpP [Thermoactinomyces daqus]
MKTQQTTKFWEIKLSAEDAKTADIFIYGDIVSSQWYEEDTTAMSFKNDLDAAGDVSMINLYINSPGGNVFEGVAIYNMLKRHKAKINVYVDALAASIASVIAMVGDTVSMPKNSMLMIHNPWSFAVGNAAELRKIADDLDRIGQSIKQTYLQKAGSKLTDEKLQEMLDAETWLSADEAYAYGLCDVVLEESQAAASISDEWLNRYKNVPKQLKNQGETPEKMAISAQEIEIRKRISEEAKANSVYIDSILGGLIR